MMVLADLHAPDDFHAQAQLWDANCGPGALAAALGTSVAHTRALVDPFAGYMGVRQMQTALHRAQQPHAAVIFPPKIWTLHDEALLSVALWRHIEFDARPMLLLVAWDGPWRDHPRAVAVYRHWIAVAPALSNVYVYDVNNAQIQEGPWCTLRAWMQHTRPLLVPARGTGGVVLQWGARLRGSRA